MSVGVRRLLLVWLGLMLLLCATLGAALLSTGAMKMAGGFVIAAAKAALVLWFFMDMRRDAPVARLATVAAFLWVAVLLTLVSADYRTRGIEPTHPNSGPVATRPSSVSTR